MGGQNVQLKIIRLHVGHILAGALEPETGWKRWIWDMDMILFIHISYNKQRETCGTAA